MPPRQPRPRQFSTKVVGVTYENEDGTSRQEIIATCDTGERVELVHDADNAHDAEAIAVRRQSGEQLGFVSARLADEIAPNMTRGFHYVAFIKALTGGGDLTAGVNLVVVVVPPGVSEEAARAYIDAVAASVGTSTGRRRTPTATGGCLVLMFLTLSAGIAAVLLVVALSLFFGGTTPTR